ncbi:MAG TPA: phage holin family protein [Opitutaceae bacterium]|nr:phage holin family protein [Opitutaceae bacterium]
MDDSLPPTSGVMTAARELLDGVLGSIHDRLELLSVEVQEEKFRLIQSFLWLGALFFTGMLALLFLSLTIVYCCQGTARLVALIVITLAYVLSAAGLALGARRYFAREPRAFDATLQELDRDRECIRPNS